MDAGHVVAAAKALESSLRPTPLVACPELGARLGLELYLKLENLQPTGSFKVRGASYKLTRLSEAQREAGVVAASSGNHGKALAWAAKRSETAVDVFVPATVDPSKLAQIEGLGARVHQGGRDCVDAEAMARAYASEKGQVYISPYNDLEVIAGQGSLGVELLQQVQADAGQAQGQPFDAIFIALGGGGLAAGVGTFLHAHWPALQVVGVSPSASPALHRCLEAGQIIEVPCYETLSDGTAGGVEADAVSFALAQRELSESILVSEQEIAAAMRLALLETKQVIEGAAGAGLAGCLAQAHARAGQRVCVVICGGNVSAQTLAHVAC